jgi:hypothetical protein
MLSKNEIDAVQIDVAAISNDDLHDAEVEFKARAEIASHGVGSDLRMGLDHSQNEYNLHLMVEYLTHIDERLENTGGWWFRIRRRLSYINQYRKNF